MFGSLLQFGWLLPSPPPVSYSGLVPSWRAFLQMSLASAFSSVCDHSSNIGLFPRRPRTRSDLRWVTDMAILPSCPGAEVEVIVNRQSLREYDDTSNTPTPPKTITKYIKATSGTEFAIHLVFTKGYPYPIGDIEQFIYFDGKIVESYLVRPANFFHPLKYFVDGRCG
jgi:hypothetical protein